MADFTAVKKNLEARGFSVTTFRTAAEAADYLDKAVDGVSVGFGGSATLDELSLYERLAAHNDVFWHWKAENAQAARRQAMTADVYFSSVNGLAESGELINIDGVGNRIAATLYGHKKV